MTDHRTRSLRAVERFEVKRLASESRGRTFARAEQLVWIVVGSMLVAAMATPAVKVIWRML